MINECFEFLTNTIGIYNTLENPPDKSQIIQFGFMWMVLSSFSYEFLRNCQDVLECNIGQWLSVAFIPKDRLPHPKGRVTSLMLFSFVFLLILQVQDTNNPIFSFSCQVWQVEKINLSLLLSSWLIIRMYCNGQCNIACAPGNFYGICFLWILGLIPFMHISVQRETGYWYWCVSIGGSYCRRCKGNC